MSEIDKTPCKPRRDEISGHPAPAHHYCEDRLTQLIEWARGYLSSEVPGQYTSDAALNLALVVWTEEQQEARAS